MARSLAPGRRGGVERGDRWPDRRRARRLGRTRPALPASPRRAGRRAHRAGRPGRGRRAEGGAWSPRAPSTTPSAGPSSAPASSAPDGPSDWHVDERHPAGPVRRQEVPPRLGAADRGGHRRSGAHGDHGVERLGRHHAGRRHRAPPHRAVHAISNVAALCLYGASRLRRAAEAGGGGGAPRPHRAGALSAGGHLGGHLSYDKVGRPADRLPRHARDWTRTVSEGEVREGEAVQSRAGDIDVMLTRTGLRACEPLHAPRLAGGRNAPRTAAWSGPPPRERVPPIGRRRDARAGRRPEPAFDVRVQDGTVEVRARSPGRTPRPRGTAQIARARRRDLESGTLSRYSGGEGSIYAAPRGSRTGSVPRRPSRRRSIRGQLPW